MISIDGLTQESDIWEGTETIIVANFNKGDAFKEDIQAYLTANYDKVPYTAVIWWPTREDDTQFIISWLSCGITPAYRGENWDYLTKWMARA